MRLVVSNLLISGMFAVTEMQFRNKLYQLSTGDPTLSHDRHIHFLREWHNLICRLNTTAGKKFLRDALQTNVNIDGTVVPTIFCSTDDTVTYTNYDEFQRVDMSAIRSSLPETVQLRKIDSFTWDHSHEELPHTHTVSVYVASQNE